MSGSGLLVNETVPMFVVYSVQKNKVENEKMFTSESVHCNQQNRSTVGNGIVKALRQQ